MKKYILPTKASGKKLKEVRILLGVTQKEFAGIIGVSKPTVERWEASEQDITGPVAGLVFYMEKYGMKDMEIPERIFPTRLWYMYKDTRCTLIDVDDSRQIIRIRNYTNQVQFRAFGTKENPNYADYIEFLESRCFASSRDKMKLVLEDLDLPFYDPFLIIQKTKGKMAEDDFWIEVEQ